MGEQGGGPDLHADARAEGGGERPLQAVARGREELEGLVALELGGQGPSSWSPFQVQLAQGQREGQGRDGPREAVVGEVEDHVRGRRGASTLSVVQLGSVALLRMRARVPVSWLPAA